MANNMRKGGAKPRLGLPSLPSLPVSPKSLISALGIAVEQGSQELTVSIVVDASLDTALVEYAKQAFRPQSGNINLAVIPYYAEVVRFAADSALVVVLANVAPATGRLLNQALRQGIPAVAVTLDAAQLQQLARDNYNEIDLDSIVTVTGGGAAAGAGGGAGGDGVGEDVAGSGIGVGSGTAGAAGGGAVGDGLPSLDEVRFQSLFKKLGQWMVRRLPDERLVLARAFDFVRQPFVNNAIQATSLQNAAIAAVFFLPGADMPLLTLNQVKLFLQIGTAYGAELDRQRLKEIALLVAGGLGFRAVARRLVGLIPVFGWAVRGAVGYGGTLAVGKAAQEYFERGGDLGELLSGLADKVTDKGTDKAAADDGASA
jgi:uncharacterized protein (DUF697 family)